MDARLKELGDRIVSMFPEISEDQKEIIFVNLELAELHGESKGMKKSHDETMRLIDVAKIQAAGH